MLRFELDDLTRPEVIALLEEHVQDMYAVSPPESVHALDLDGFRAPGLSFWTAWEPGPDGETLLGCGALHEVEPGHAELKTMRTAAGARGRGVAAQLLEHLLSQARLRGCTRVSIETGSQEFFAPARRLYARNGFVECEPFGPYAPDPNSVFMTREL